MATALSRSTGRPGLAARLRSRFGQVWRRLLAIALHAGLGALVGAGVTSLATLLWRSALDALRIASSALARHAQHHPEMTLGMLAGAMAGLVWLALRRS